MSSSPVASPLPGRIVLLLAAVLCVAVGVSQSFQDMRSDDWTYLAWGRSNPGWASFLLSPPPFPYFRPLNALAWQVQVHQFGAGAWPLQTALLTLWLAGLGLLGAVVARRVGPGGWAGALAAVAAVTLALVTPELRDLPNWRSWITTVGGITGLLGALLLATRKRPVAAFAVLALGAGFKEVAWWNGAWALAAVGELPLAGAALAAFAIHAGIAAGGHQPGEIALSHLPANLHRVGSTLLGWGWPLPLAAVVLLAPRDAWRDGSGRLVVAAAAGTVPVLVFYLYNPTYILEAMLILLVALLPPAAAAARRFPRVVWVVAAGTSLYLARPAAWDDYHENVPFQARRQQEGRDLAARGVGATAVWAPVDDQGPCGLAARLLTYEGGATTLPERPGDGEVLADCLVVRR